MIISPVIWLHVASAGVYLGTTLGLDKIAAGQWLCLIYVFLAFCPSKHG